MENSIKMFTQINADTGYHEVHKINSDGFEKIFKYNDLNQLIEFTYSNGYKVTYEYNKFGSITHMACSSGFEYWKEYTEDLNLLTYYKNTSGLERRFVYIGDTLIYAKYVLLNHVEEYARDIFNGYFSRIH